MSFGERLLLTLSRQPPPSGHDVSERSKPTDAASLSLLGQVFPEFLQLIRNKVILDFGCGEGYQAVALARAGARRVIGIDTNPRALETARKLPTAAVQDRVEFRESLSTCSTKTFDVVISKDSMEHFADPMEVLREMCDVLKPDGKLLITFGPPWYAPYGSHMHFFTPLPWVNILFSEKTVMSVRGRYRDDGATRYEEVASGLNRMSVAKFERIVQDCGLDLGYRRYDCVKRLAFLGKVPLLRELFINQVSVILTKEGRGLPRPRDEAVR